MEKNKRGNGKWRGYRIKYGVEVRFFWDDIYLKIERDDDSK